MNAPPITFGLVVRSARVDVRRLDPRMAAVDVSLRVPHVTTGEEITVRQTRDVEVVLVEDASPEGRRRFGEVVRRIAIELLSHEVDEQLRIAGAYVRRPEHGR